MHMSAMPDAPPAPLVPPAPLAPPAPPVEAHTHVPYAIPVGERGSLVHVRVPLPAPQLHETGAWPAMHASPPKPLMPDEPPSPIPCPLVPPLAPGLPAVPYVGTPSAHAASSDNAITRPNCRKEPWRRTTDHKLSFDCIASLLSTYPARTVAQNGDSAAGNSAEAGRGSAWPGGRG